MSALNDSYKFIKHIQEENVQVDSAAKPFDRGAAGAEQKCQSLLYQIHQEFIISVRLWVKRAPGWKGKRVSAVWLANHAAAVMETKIYNYKLLYLYLYVCSYVCLYVCMFVCVSVWLANHAAAVMEIKVYNY